MRALCTIAVVLGAVVVDACATTPATPPVATTPSAPPPKKRHKKPAPPPEEPHVVTGPDVEPPPEEPPPEQPPVDDGPSESGLASYYADSLAGNKTASGERYKPDLRTCAHRTYPFGTILEVKAGGRSTTCRVNDRGPFVKDRILDVSKKCAKELGMLGPGILKVRVREARELVPDPG